jgi:hypothetical protein
MTSTVAPDPWPEAAQHCPRCRRAIPGGIRHPFVGWVIPGPQAPTDAELRSHCPIHGPSGSQYPPRDRSVAALAAQVHALAQSLGDDGEGSWSKMLTAAAEREPDEEKLTWMGHAIALLLERGPRHWWRQQADWQDARQLLADLVVKWPAGDA